MIGITISLAGNPKINANKITPSRPMHLAKGSRKLEVLDIQDTTKKEEAKDLFKYL